MRSKIPIPPNYLKPYADAASRHGGGFRSLLWASRATQEARFAVFTQLCNLRGKTILDVGCGRADFLDFLLNREIQPAHYVGIEAVEALADEASAKKDRPGGVRAVIIRGDFVRAPVKMFVGAEVVIFSGSLNTLSQTEFYDTLQKAFEATAGELIFNFLDSDTLAGAPYLTWHRPAHVRQFFDSLTSDVREFTGYLDGDRTIAARKAID